MRTSDAAGAEPVGGALPAGRALSEEPAKPGDGALPAERTLSEEARAAGGGPADGGGEVFEAEVVIAGAGPTGLTLAGELALAGVDVLVLEKLPERVEQTKGGSLQPRTAELLQLRGLLEPLLRRALPREPVGGHFAMLPVPLDCSPWRTRHPYPIGIPQWVIEEVLEERAVAHGARVRRGAAVTAVHPGSGDGSPDPAARVAQDGPAGSAGPVGPDGSPDPAAPVTVIAGRTQVRARYLVACDGGRSTVRRLLGLPFPGRDGTYLAVLTDVRLPSVSSLVPRRAGHVSSLVRQVDGYWGMLVPVGDERYRFTYGRTRYVDAGRDTPVTDDEIGTALRALYGAQTVLGEVYNAGRFTDATRQLEQYRVGDVLFAGDAAHIHPPLGGQGLNLGMQDAFNLGWKLAATLRGRAPAGLLDGYHTERHPAAAQVLHHTSAQRVLADPQASADVAALREIVTDLLRLPDTNRHLAGLMSGLALSYPSLRETPLSGTPPRATSPSGTSPSETPPPGTPVPGTSPSCEPPGVHPLTGHRVPDADLCTPAGTVRLSELFRAGNAVLLDLAGVVPDGLRLPAGVDLCRAACPDDDLGAAALLLRPDGYVCWATGSTTDAGTTDSATEAGATDRTGDATGCPATLLPAIRAHLTTATQAATATKPATVATQPATARTATTA